MSTTDFPLLEKVRIATEKDAVYKDECCFSFATQESPGGIFVDLTNFIGVGSQFLDKYHARTGVPYFLNIRKIPLPKPEKKETEDPPQKITKLAIGVEGGIPIDEKKFKEETEIILLPQKTIFPFPSDSLPEKLKKAAEAVLSLNSVNRKDELNSWEDKREVSLHALELVQLDNGVKIPPTGNKCRDCTLTSNLWLNLTDGAVLCGRRQPDGSGGNEHAARHYELTKYPLVVKLGTITADGADVYSYPEDNMVTDPYLEKHLNHFGINPALMSKTDKTMAELELDQNLKYDFSRLTAEGKKQIPLSGPGLTGIRNLGNSCYLSSVIQVVFSIPEFQKRYFLNEEQLFNNAPSNAPIHFHTQFSKLANGLMSGRYSDPESDGIGPRMFKILIGKGHKEFSTSQQQDALEFFQYLMEVIERNERAAGSNLDPSLVFKFKIEDRIECLSSGKVKYTTRKDNILSLPIPQEKASNRAEVLEYEKRKKEIEDKGEKCTEEPVRPKVTLKQCFEAFGAPEILTEFYSEAINGKTTASKTSKVSSFPDVLTIQLRKFYLDQQWNPRKLGALVDVPEEIDLEWLRGTGLQPGEQEMGGAPQQGDPAIVNELMMMGFPEVRCQKAAIKNKNLEDALNWLMAHMEDPDIDEPIQKSKGAAAGPPVNEENVATIISMGFTREQALKALKETNNDVARATDWIFSHMDELDSLTSEPQQKAEAPQGGEHDGPAKYQLFAFISHMGSSTGSGHYVCHIKRDKQWVLFNDSKVLLCEDPPSDMGYIYFFRRVGK